MKGKIIYIQSKKDGGLPFIVTDTIVINGETHYLSSDIFKVSHIIKAQDIFEIEEAQKPDLVEITLKYLKIAQQIIPEIIYQIESANPLTKARDGNGENGLNHSMEHLQSMRYKVQLLPLEEMEKYADEICKNMVHAGNKFDHLIANSILEDIDFSIMNTTSIGNLAYIVNHHKVHENQQAAMIMIQRYQAYVLNLGL